MNSLVGEFVDASLGLLPRGGRFIEMGKTDVRDAERVAEEWPGVRYRAFDLVEAAGAARIQEMLVELVELFERGVLEHLPVSTWDVRRAVEAFRFVREGRHVGKVVLTVPQPVDREGTVLVTGGTGGLGGLVARHLARDGARHLLLVSRGGSGVDGVSGLVGELEGFGCEAEVAACDVGDREQLAGVIASIPAARPLVSVIHVAGVLDDGVLESLSEEQLERVMRPKVDGAVHLHELTAGLGLSEFVMFSSAAGLFGGAGQGNYAAANAFLDALAQARRAQGLAGQSLAWGLWEQQSGMTESLGQSARARLARAGLAGLATRQGLELLDRARDIDEAVLVPARLDFGGLRARERAGALPALLSGLVRTSARGERGGEGSLVQRLAGVPASEWERCPAGCGACPGGGGAGTGPSAAGGSRACVQRARPRLAGGARVAQPSDRGDGLAAAEDAGVRPHELSRGRGIPAYPGGWRGSRCGRCARSGPSRAERTSTSRSRSWV